MLIRLSPRYGAVVRGANAYVPPGARRQNSETDATKQSENDQALKTESVATVPKLSVNAPDGSEKTVPRTGAAAAAGAASGSKVRFRSQLRMMMVSSMRSVCIAATRRCSPCFPRLRYQ